MINSHINSTLNVYYVMFQIIFPNVVLEWCDASREFYISMLRTRYVTCENYKHYHALFLLRFLSLSRNAIFSLLSYHFISHYITYHFVTSHHITLSFSLFILYYHIIKLLLLLVFSLFLGTYFFFFVFLFSHFIFFCCIIYHSLILLFFHI